MVIKNNLSALNNNRSHESNQTARAKSSEKLSSGYKINRGADDASGLSVSEKMLRQIFALSKATANAQDGISSMQIADGALGQVNEMLNRMNELGVQAGNETLSEEQRYSIQAEMNALRSEVDRIAETTTFNGQKLLDGSFSGKRLQVGAEATDENQISITIGNMNWDSISGNRPVSIESGQLAETMQGIRSAMQGISTMRSDMGAVQNRLGNTVSNLRNATENTMAANSNIRDTDMASEMVRNSNRNILARTQEAIQAQANQNNRNVLSLLN
ncbi:MAG: flagellin [Lachnospiraceae bacterium]|nr:flagellin [Lachnospiraceae bacterium]